MQWIQLGLKYSLIFLISSCKNIKKMQNIFFCIFGLWIRINVLCRKASESVYFKTYIRYHIFIIKYNCNYPVVKTKWQLAGVSRWIIIGCELSWRVLVMMLDELWLIVISFGAFLVALFSACLPFLSAHLWENVIFYISSLKQLLIAD